MNRISARTSVSAVRRVARIIGTLVGSIGLLGILEGLGDSLEYGWHAQIADYLVGVGAVLILAGCIVGWFKELAAALLILGGCAILFVMSVRRPGALLLIIFPALVGLLYLFIHLGTKKK